MIKEVCVENFTDVPEAVACGADRIELCDNLAEGGTTVSKGVLEKTLAYCKEKEIPVMTIIRPRGGDFIYDQDEKEIMLNDLQTAVNAGSAGIVIGALNADGGIDRDFMETVMALCAKTAVTFHMAFDEIAKEKQFDAIDYLAEIGVERILTHGGPGGVPIKKNKNHLKELAEYAENRIVILPGGGIDWKNAAEIVDYLGVKEAHGTRIVDYFH